MCKFTPCKGQVTHWPGQCPEKSYGEDCDGIAHYIDDPYYTAQGLPAKLRWLCEGESIRRFMDS